MSCSGAARNVTGPPPAEMADEQVRRREDRAGEQDQERHRDEHDDEGEHERERPGQREHEEQPGTCQESDGRPEPGDHADQRPVSSTSSRTLEGSDAQRETWERPSGIDSGAIGARGGLMSSVVFMPRAWPVTRALSSG